MSYEQQVQAAAAALKKGEDSNWELARLTYENTNRRGENRSGTVSHEKWADDVRQQSGRKFSERTSKRYAEMWERFGMSANVGTLSWTDAAYELAPRETGVATRARSADIHIEKEASPERKREIFQKLVQDPEVLADVATEAVAREALHNVSVERVEKAEARNENNESQQRLAKIGHQLDAASDIGKARRLLISALDEVSQLDSDQLDECRQFLLTNLSSVEVAASWLRSFLDYGDRSWDRALADFLAGGE